MKFSDFFNEVKSLVVDGGMNESIVYKVKNTIHDFYSNDCYSTKDVADMILDGVF